MVELRRTHEKTGKMMLFVEIAMIVVSIIFLAAMVLICAYVDTDVLWKIVLVSVASVTVIAAIAICCAIEIKVGFFECPECGHRYVPTVGNYVMAPHMGWTRKLKCPNCGKRCWHKKILVK